MPFLYLSMSQNPNVKTSSQATVPHFDPQVQPVIKQPISQLLQPRALELDFIQRAFQQPVNWQVEPIFTDLFSDDVADYGGLRRAAVFMPLVQRESGLHVIFTRRAEHLYDHAGQICFPGGRIEVDDLDEIAAALRETHEEIGVPSEYVQLIGTQPGFVTTTRFVMKPVIGWLKPGFTVKADTREVAEVFEVPLAVLMDPARHHLHQAPVAGGAERFYFSIRWRSYFIWGATAALVRNFYRYLAAAQDGQR